MGRAAVFAMTIAMSFVIAFTTIIFVIRFGRHSRLGRSVFVIIGSLVRPIGAWQARPRKIPTDTAIFDTVSVKAGSAAAAELDVAGLAKRSHICIAAIPASDARRTGLIDFRKVAEFETVSVKAFGSATGNLEAKLLRLHWLHGDVTICSSVPGRPVNKQCSASLKILNIPFEFDWSFETSPLGLLGLHLLLGNTDVGIVAVAADSLLRFFDGLPNGLAGHGKLAALDRVDDLGLERHDGSWWICSR